MWMLERGILIIRLAITNTKKQTVIIAEKDILEQEAKNAVSRMRYDAVLARCRRELPVSVRSAPSAIIRTQTKTM